MLCEGSLYLSVLAGDDDLVREPGWMQGVMLTSARLVNVGRLSPLPVRTFEIWREHAMAFRLLQSGNNTGKVVLRIMPTVGTLLPESRTHIITGGTGGLGLITARWLLGQGVRYLALAARTPKPLRSIVLRG